MAYMQGKLTHNVNVSPPTPLKSLVGLVLGLVLALALLLAAIVLVSNFLAPYIPASVEERLGAGIQEVFRAEAVDDFRARRVERVLEQLLPYLSEDDRRLDYLPLVLEDEIFNALALPGGTIVVFTGLLDKVDHDAELAFVLSHELGHFHGRDHLRGMGLDLGIQLISMLLVGENSGTSELAMTAAKLMTLHYSRKQEKAADIFALELLAKAGEPLSGAVGFMEKIRDMDDRVRFEQYFSTHPHSSDRLLYLREEMGRLGQ